MGNIYIHVIRTGPFLPLLLPDKWTVPKNSCDDIRRAQGAGEVSLGLSAWLFPCPSTLALLSPVQVPLVPFIPGTSILLNVFLMLKLSPLTWVRFIIWLVAGKVPLLASHVHNTERLFHSMAIRFTCSSSSLYDGLVSCPWCPLPYAL